MREGLGNLKLGENSNFKLQFIVSEEASKQE